MIPSASRHMLGVPARPAAQASFVIPHAVSGVSTRLSSSGIAIFAGIGRVVLAPARAVVLLAGLAACAGSPAPAALHPDFEVMTPAGVASVSVRQPLPEMTEAQFAQLVSIGMRPVARENVIAGSGEPQTPSQRIVWHDNLAPSRGMSLLVVNVFDGADPYAYEMATVPNDAPTMVITSAIESMSVRLLADIAAHANLSVDGSRRFATVTRSSETTTGSWGSTSEPTVLNLLTQIRDSIDRGRSAQG
jgi:hypothetical protein